MKELRCAIVGLGVIGRLHAEILCKQGKHIIALCDIDGTVAEEVREKLALDAAVYTDWEKMLSEIRLDVVHICTPHYLHAQMTIGALERGINVLCEKPLCISREELERVLCAEAKSDATLGVVHQNRFKPSNVFAKQYLSDKKILSAHASVVWQRTDEYYKSASWRGTIAQEGGGVLINQALHTLDLLQWMTRMPTHVSAICGCLTLGDQIEVEDTASMRFFGDVPMTFFATNSGGANMEVELRFVLSGGHKITVRPDSVQIDGELLDFHRTELADGGKAYYGNAHGMLIERFYQCVALGEKFEIGGAEAANVMRMILASYESRGKSTEL